MPYSVVFHLSGPTAYARMIELVCIRHEIIDTALYTILHGELRAQTLAR